MGRLVAQQAKFWGIFAYVGAVAGTPIFALITAAVLLLFFTLFLGGRAKFGKIFGVVAYAQLPSLLSMAAMIVVMRLKAPEDYDLQNPIGLNVGFYLPHDSLPKWLISLAGSIDLMSFWMIALLAIGLAAVDPKSPRSRAWTAVLLPWGIYVLGKAGVAALRG